MKLRCNKIIVTGGASGIGLAIAKRVMEEEGVQVVLAGRYMDRLEAAKNEIGKPGVHCLVWDVSDVSVCKARIEEAAAMMGGVNGLVNAAGLGTNQLTGRGYEPWDITEDEWEQLIGTNLTGPYFLMRDMVNHMTEHGEKGNILNIASNAACMDVVGAYGSSKSALIRLTRALGKRYGERGIIINGIAPGATLTRMISYYATSIDQPYPRHAIGRFIRVEEMAELAYYLMSDYGEIICGHTVVADGGDKNATL